MPRNLSFHNSSVSLGFNGSDLILSRAQLHTGSSSLHIRGTVKNFLNLYYSDPDKIVMDWKVTSPNIDLNQFLAFVGRRKTVKVKRSPYARIEHIAERVDDALDQGSVDMQVDVDRLVYRKFVAAGISAGVSLKHTGISLQDVRLSNSGGLLLLNADIDQNQADNRFALSATADKINVQEFFTAFENFGQDAITNEHIRGILHTRVKVDGRMHPDGRIIPASLTGTIDARLQQGALISFPPFKRISKLIFRHRDMEHVTFGNLSTRLAVNGHFITIAPTHIESSAITANVGGVYSLTTGTRLDIDVAMRNPKKDELIVNDSLRAARSMKGIIIRLKGVDGDDGNVKIKFAGIKF